MMVFSDSFDSDLWHSSVASVQGDLPLVWVPTGKRTISSEDEQFPEKSDCASSWPDYSRDLGYFRGPERGF